MRFIRTSVSTLAAFAVLLGSSATDGLAATVPVGPLPPGATASTITHTGQLLAIALPRLRRNEGYTWRVARRVDARVIREVSEADLGGNVVVLFRVVGRGEATIVFALTRGDSSAKAVRAYRHRVYAR